MTMTARMKTSERAAWTVLAVLFVLNLVNLARFTLDVPVNDDWQLYANDALPRGLTLAWLFQPHNEHRIVLTKILSWLFYAVDGGDLEHMQIFNFLVYGAGVALYARLLVRAASHATAPGWLAPVALLPLASALPKENHLWATQSQFHFGWIAPLALAFVLFDGPLTRKRAAIAVLAAVAGMWSFAGAVPAVAVVAAFFAFTRRGLRRADIVFLAATAGAFVVWAATYEGAGHQAPATVWPTQLLFWEFLTNMVSAGFGYLKVGTGLAVVCSGLVLTALVGASARRSDETLGLVAFAWGCVAFLATVAASRAAFGLVAAKFERYAEIALLLVPAAALSLWVLLREKPWPRRLALAVTAGLCVVGVGPRFNFQRAYGSEYRRRAPSGDCLAAYYFHGGAPDCGPGTSREALDNARLLRVRFYERLSATERLTLGKEIPPNQ